MVGFLHVRRWEKRNRTDFYWRVVVYNMGVLKHFGTTKFIHIFLFQKVTVPKIKIWPTGQNVSIIPYCILLIGHIFYDCMASGNYDGTLPVKSLSKPVTIESAATVENEKTLSRHRIKFFWRCLFLVWLFFKEDLLTAGCWFNSI